MGGFKRVAAALELAYLPARRGRSAAGAWSPGDVQSPLALVQFGSSQHTVSISEVPHNSSLARPRMTQRFDTCGTCQGRCSATRTVTSIAEVGKQLPSISELWIAVNLTLLLWISGASAPIFCRSAAHSHGGQQGSVRAKWAGEGTPRGAAGDGATSQIRRRLRFPRHTGVAGMKHSE